VFDYGVQDIRDNTAIVRRYGEAIFPVDVLVTFDDGEQVVEHWDGASRWKAYAYTRPSRIRTVQVDPKRVLLLDVNYTNNSKTRRPAGPAAATKWATRWMVWLQDCLLSWAALV
jgi:hypothetical protein